jgi:hypothetical protein
MTPDPRLDALQQALARQAAAKQQMAGLDEQYDRAAALRDAEQPQINRYGTVSPLAVIADMVGKSRGRKQMRELEPQREAARQQMAESAGGLPMWRAQQQLAGQDMRQEQFDYQKAQDTAKREQELADTQAAHERAIELQKLKNKKTSGTRSRWQTIKGKDPYGNDVVRLVDKWGEEEPQISFADGTTYDPVAAQTKGGTRAGQAGAETGAKEAAKTDIKRQAELSGQSRDAMQTLNSIDQAINALKGGANTGPIAHRLYSLRGPTLALENAQQRMGLTQIGAYTFGSLSEAEGEWLRQSEIPMDLNEDDLLGYMEHRKEATMRVLEANQYEKEALAAGEPVDQELIRAILTDGGFDIRKEGWKK